MYAHTYVCMYKTACRSLELTFSILANENGLNAIDDAANRDTFNANTTTLDDYHCHQCHTKRMSTIELNIKAAFRAQNFKTSHVRLENEGIMQSR